MSGWLSKLKQYLPFLESFNNMHFIAYFGLALTYLWGFGSIGFNWKIKIFVIFLCLLYGISDEYHQSFVSGRASDIYDIRNDTIGAVVAVTLVSVPPFRHLWEKLLLKYEKMIT